MSNALFPHARDKVATFLIAKVQVPRAVDASDLGSSSTSLDWTWHLIYAQEQINLANLVQLFFLQILQIVSPLGKFKLMLCLAFVFECLTNWMFRC